MTPPRYNKSPWVLHDVCEWYVSDPRGCKRNTQRRAFQSCVPLVERTYPAFSNEHYSILLKFEKMRRLLEKGRFLALLLRSLCRSAQSCRLLGLEAGGLNALHRWKGQRADRLVFFTPGQSSWWCCGSLQIITRLLFLRSLYDQWA